MLLGYNTNGLCHHDPVEAVELLADLGYQSAAITIDQHSLSPYRHSWKADLERLRETLERRQLRNVLETGARFLLDRNTKHEPTLMTADPAARQRRIEFYCRVIEMAAELGSDCVSLWSGVLRTECSEEIAFQRLVEGLEPVLDYAAKFNVQIGFEPEPGMFIDTMPQYDRLLDLLDAPHFLLTLDVGHLHCLGETPLDAYVRRYAAKIVNVHIEDMVHGVHEHLPFGAGEIDFAPVMQAFRDIQYTGGIHVELSRHSHEGPQRARESYQFLKSLM